jgi:hypothetical protein
MFAAGNATLTRTPVNQGVFVGGSIRLNCTSNVSTIAWKNSTLAIIFNGAIIVGKKFQLDSTSLYDMYANNVDASYADIYTCFESSSVNASASIVVFGECFYSAFRFTNRFYFASKHQIYTHYLNP